MNITPFEFFTSLPLVELTNLKAKNIPELLEIIKTIDGSSIFYHTHHHVREHHFLPEEYSSDFAYWVSDILQEKSLAEKLMLIDILEFNTIRAIREEYIKIIEDYISTEPKMRDAAEGMEFNFCRVKSIVVSTGYTAKTLSEFTNCLRKVDINSIYYHLIEARLRIERKSNDISIWIETNFNKRTLANAINSIEPYFLTLEQIREKIISLVEKEKYIERVKSKFKQYITQENVSAFVKEKKPFKKIKETINKILWK